MRLLLTFLRTSTPVRHQMIATLVCLVALLLALLVGLWSPTLAIVLFFVSFAAGLLFPVVESAGKVAQGDVDVDFLMILVALGAWALGHPAEGAALLVLFGASRAMESYARGRTHASLAELLAELPRRATRIEGATTREVDVADVRIGDVLLVRPGERFPVDVTFVEGTTSIDLSAITGEAHPVAPQPGADIPSGAINGTGLVTVRVAHLACDSAYQKIIALVESAPARQSPAQVLSDRIGRWYTWVILSASVLAFVVWWKVMGLSFEVAGYRAMVLLVAGSPCAIVLSLPSAILAAISSGARRGILFNGGRGLMALPLVRRVAFDKTGTLSTGEPGVVKILGDAIEDSDVLAVAHELARSSTHPASRSVVRYFRERHHPAADDITDVFEVPGRGIVGTWRVQSVELGRARGCDILMDHEDPDLSRVVLFVAGRPRIRFYLSENPREQAAPVVQQLHAVGVVSLILSGDAQRAVARMARSIGVDDARGDLRPEDKFRIVGELAAEPGGVAMVGDGVNDAPALAAASVGVAMGVRGSAATLAQADIILVKDRLTDLAEARHLGILTRRIVAQNLTIAVGAAAVMVVAALFGSLPLALGVFGHEGGTVLVVLNSLRLLTTSSGSPISAPAPSVKRRQPVLRAS